MHKRNKRFRKQSLTDYKIEDDISKLEFLLNTRNFIDGYNNSVRKSVTIKRDGIIENSRDSLRFKSCDIAKTNEDNVRTLFQVYRKKFN